MSHINESCTIIITRRHREPRCRSWKANANKLVTSDVSIGSIMTTLEMVESYDSSRLVDVKMYRLCA
jgi:hypothetical protein